MLPQAGTAGAATSIAGRCRDLGLRLCALVFAGEGLFEVTTRAAPGVWWLPWLSIGLLEGPLLAFALHAKELIGQKRRVEAGQTIRITWLLASASAVIVTSEALDGAAGRIRRADRSQRLITRPAVQVAERGGRCTAFSPPPSGRRSSSSITEPSAPVPGPRSAAAWRAASPSASVCRRRSIAGGRPRWRRGWSPRGARRRPGVAPAFVRVRQLAALKLRPSKPLKVWKSLAGKVSA